MDTVLIAVIVTDGIDVGLVADGGGGNIVGVIGECGAGVEA